MKKIDTEKLTKWSKEIYHNAVAHGWHEEKHSSEHYLGLIMTEVAEAIEADRKCRRVPDDAYKSLFVGHITWYQNFVKGTIEEEMADIVIRLLDMAYAIHGEKMVFIGCQYDSLYAKNKSFVENAWCFTKEVLNYGTMNISYSIIYIYDWAEHINIDLDQHIIWKMRYNTFRGYKHGGKKY